MDSYMSMDRATCAENFKASATEADWYVSGLVGFLNGFAPTYLAIAFGGMGLWLGASVLTWWFFFGLPVFFLGAIAIMAVVPILALPININQYLPSMTNVVRWKLVEMKGYYACAIGEEGFT